MLAGKFYKSNFPKKNLAGQFPFQISCKFSIILFRPCMLTCLCIHQGPLYDFRGPANISVSVGRVSQMELFLRLDADWYELFCALIIPTCRSLVW